MKPEPSTLVDFYEQRYTEGYMEEWSEEKKDRVRSLVRGLGLPGTGKAIEFGCGNGVFTKVLAEALPGWTVRGVDISSVAIEKARARYPDISFGLVPDFMDHQFDFVFTHHTLEHVADLNETLNQIDRFLKPNAHILHILPCGNEGSFEQKRAKAVNGIEPSGRFFFEDEGHLRRLTTQDLVEAYVKRGYSLAAEYYANQFWGALEWISAEGMSRAKQFGLLACIIRLARRGVKGIRVRGADRLIRWLAKNEWETKKDNRAGSEMYLFFEMGRWNGH